MEIFYVRNGDDESGLQVRFPSPGDTRGISGSSLSIVTCGGAAGSDVFSTEEAFGVHVASESQLFTIPPRSYAMLRLDISGSMRLALELSFLLEDQAGSGHYTNNGGSGGGTSGDSHGRCLSVTVHRAKRGARTAVEVCPRGGGWVAVGPAACSFSPSDAAENSERHRGEGEHSLFTTIPSDVMSSMPRMAQWTSGHAGDGSEPPAADSLFGMEWSVETSARGARHQISSVCVARQRPGDARIGAQAVRRVGSDWMASMWDTIADLPLPQLAVPGSHDCGAFYLSGRVSRLAAPSPLMKAAPSGVIRKWGVTQGVGITEQLEYGSRYFDMRVAYCGERDDFLFVHTLLGGSVWHMLDEIAAFSEAHPRELIYVDFNHFYLGGDVEIEARFFRELAAHRISTRAAARNHFYEATVRSVVEAGTPVVLMAPGNLIDYHAIDAPLWPGNKIVPDSWPRATTGSQLRDNNLSIAARLKTNPKVMFVLQGILTPDAGVIAPSVFGRGMRTLEEYAVEATVVTAGAEPQAFCGAGSTVGVVLLDFVTRSPALEMCVAVNRARHKARQSPS